MKKSVRRHAASGLAALAAATLLSGCSLQALGMGATPTGANRPGAGSSATATSASTRHHDAAGARAVSDTNSDTNSDTTDHVGGSLAAGTVTHKLAAGSRQLVLTYWTTQNVGTWTADKPVTVNVSAHLENSRRSVRVLVTTFAATFTTDDGADATVLRRDRGRFVITPPFSYVSAVVVPAVSGATRSAHADIEFDLLVETAPGSHAYARQTVLDSLNFTYRAGKGRS